MIESSVQVVRLTGELDMTRRTEIVRDLQLDAGSGGVLVDLSAVTYADSTIIAELLRLRAEADAAGRPLALLIGGARLMRLLQYAGIPDAFDVFEQRAAALTALAKRRS